MSKRRMSVVHIDILGEQDMVLDELHTLIKETRKEEGNIAYDLYKEDDNFNHFIAIKEFKNSEAIKKHQTSPHYIRWVSTCARFMKLRIMNAEELNTK